MSPNSFFTCLSRLLNCLSFFLIIAPVSVVSEVIESLPPRKKDSKYTPLSLRQEKPYAILWLIKRYPDELSSSQIAKLTGSTKNTVEAIRNGTFREAVLEAKSPMDTGLCSYQDLEKALNRAKNKRDREEAKAKSLAKENTN